MLNYDFRKLERFVGKAGTDKEGEEIQQMATKVAGNNYKLHKISGSKSQSSPLNQNLYVLAGITTLYTSI